MRYTKLSRSTFTSRIGLWWHLLGNLHCKGTIELADGEKWVYCWTCRKGWATYDDVLAAENA